MKKNLLLVFATLFSICFVKAQNPPAACSEIFISEYMEGTNNNKAIEIFNPTNKEVDLSGYQLARNNNGGTSLALTKIPAGTKVAAYKTHVFVLDKRDTTKYSTGLEFPIWDGFQVWDTCKDATGKVIIDTVTKTAQFCIQVDPANGNLPKRAKKYNDFLDLQCRANSFINPVFDGAMYFNGNDAVMLFKGVPDSVGFTNLVDMVGIYNDPAMLVSGSTWKDFRGRVLTTDRNLIRKREVRGGTGIVANVRNDTFRYADWLVFVSNNFSPSFQNLGSHTCDCDPNPPVSSRRLCNGSIIAANEEIAPVNFNIYPNPSVSGNISINAESPIEQITVINLMGQVVDSRKIPIQSESIQLSLNNVHRGIYFIQVRTTDNRIGVKKLVIE
jgi:predicted RecA/RadA family phage recombinase